MGADVTIYTTSYCGYCVRAKQLLGQKKVAYREIDVGDAPALRKWLMDTTRQRTVPQVFINGKPVGGFSDIAELDSRGKLDPLLAEPPKPGDPELRVA